MRPCPQLPRGPRARVPGGIPAAEAVEPFWDRGAPGSQPAPRALLCSPSLFPEATCQLAPTEVRPEPAAQSGNAENQYQCKEAALGSVSLGMSWPRPPTPGPSDPSSVGGPAL